VNVLLVPAHPGFPGQIPQSRKTVVCVCVDVTDMGVNVSYDRINISNKYIKILSHYTNSDEFLDKIRALTLLVER